MSEWGDRAAAFIESLPGGVTFDANTVRSICGNPDPAHTANSGQNATGPVFTSAEGAGLIEKTGEYHKAWLPERKSGMIREWRRVVERKTSLRDQIRSCTQCELRAGCNEPVPYRGRRSRILILGEAPGAREDEQGRPFVGPAGQKLWRGLAKVGIEKEEVFACNAVSCYPHGTPSESQILACRGNVYAQVRLCGPSFILALGLPANRTLGSDEPMNQLHGTWRPLRWFADEIQVFATYHPAAVLRDTTLNRAFRNDLKAFAEEAREW